MFFCGAFGLGGEGAACIISESDDFPCRISGLGGDVGWGALGLGGSDVRDTLSDVGTGVGIGGAFALGVVEYERSGLRGSVG